MLKTRLDHPILGPIATSFLIWNWELLLYTGGAVAHPIESVSAAKAYIASHSSVDLIGPPLISGLLYAFFAPWLATVIFRKFELYIDRIRNELEGSSRELDPIPGKNFNELYEYANIQNKALSEIGQQLAKYRENTKDVLANTYELIRHTGGTNVKDARNQIANLIEELSRIKAAEAKAANLTITDTLGPIRTKARAGKWYK